MKKIFITEHSNPKIREKKLIKELENIFHNYAQEKYFDDVFSYSLNNCANEKKVLYDHVVIDVYEHFKLNNEILKLIFSYYILRKSCKISFVLKRSCNNIMIRAEAIMSSMGAFEFTRYNIFDDEIIINAVYQGSTAELFHRVTTSNIWKKMFDEFIDFCGHNYDNVLDVGCASGEMLRNSNLKFSHGVGIDLSIEHIKKAKKLSENCKKKMEFMAANIYDLSLPMKFDLCTCTNLLFFLKEPEKALEKIVSFLKPGGTIAILNPSEKFTAVSDISFIEKMDFDSKQSLASYRRMAILNNSITKDFVRRCFYNLKIKNLECRDIIKKDICLAIKGVKSD